MPIVNSNESRIQRYLPFLNANSRFIHGLEGFWPLTEGQGQQCNNLAYPSSCLQKDTFKFTFENAKLPVFQKCLRIQGGSIVDGGRVINSNLGMWERVNGIEQVTMSIWMKLDSGQDTTNPALLFGWYAYEKFLGFNFGGGNLKYSLDEITPLSLSYGSDYCDSQWHFFTAVWRWTDYKLRLYADGKFVVDGTWAQHTEGPLTLGIGSDGETNSGYAYMFGAALWTWGLSDSDIDYLYKNPYELIAVQNYRELNGVAGATRIPDLMPFFIS